MKKRSLGLVAVLSILVSSQSFADDVLPIEKVCSSEVVEHLEQPITQDADLFYYYLSLMEGSCYPDIDLDRIDPVKVLQHFAALGEPLAQYSLDNDIEALLAKARAGDVSAQIYTVLKNTEYNSIGKVNTAEQTVVIPREELNRYITAMVALAQKGDARAILPTIVYMIDAPNPAYTVETRFNIAHDLVERFGQFNMMYAVMLNMWKITHSDFEICISEDETMLIDRQNMSVLCGMAFDRKRYDELKTMSSKERLVSFKNYLASVKLSDEEVETREGAVKWLEEMRTVSIYSLLEVPYSRELLPYMVYRPYGQYRLQEIRAEYWYEKYATTHTVDETNFKLLLALSSHLYLIDSSQAEAVRESFTDFIPFSENLYIYSHVKRGEHVKAEELYLKQVFEHGDIDALHNLSMIYEFVIKDHVKARALMDIYSEYRPDFSEHILSSFRRTGHFKENSPEFELQVKEQTKRFKKKLPKDASTTQFFLTWNDALKPYLIGKLDQLIAEADKSQ
ncbi:hypothetical protein [Vibrio sinaloensis]|uniref:hypothetical protein n=1 Tax=Photobacterium sp. (strain ATCC 43367) TaxID=379097 RepID=UPI0035E7B2A6